MRISLLSFTVALQFLFPSLTWARGKAHHVVVIVWDGMRPDFVSKEYSPTLYSLLQRGVFFAHHHSVYLSATEVNGTAISTGAYPAHDGIIGNSEYRPEIDPLKSIHTEIQSAVRKGDQVAHGHYLRRATLAEIIRGAGRKAVVAGAKPVALLADRGPRTSSANGVNVFAGSTLPADLAATLIDRHGEFPTEDATSPTRNDWTADAFLDLWADGVPEFSFLWMNEPDSSQHRTGPGSEQSLAAIRNTDHNLAKILQALESKGVRQSTDLIIVSDHGCSTISKKVDLADALQKIGLKATREFKTNPAAGEILIVSNSGSSMIYVIGHDHKIIDLVVRFLQQWPHSGVIFTRKTMPGTFALRRVHLDSGDAPDVVVSMRWTAEENKNGTLGLVTTDSTSYGEGQGIHVTLSPFDMHGTLIAAGPDFRADIQSPIPSGNVDVAPTVLWILGIKPPKRMDGRVLAEALTIPFPAVKISEPHRLETTRALEGATWHQYLKVSEVNGVDYFDEGNGSQTDGTIQGRNR